MNYEERLARMEKQLRRAQRTMIGLVFLVILIVGVAANGPFVDLVFGSLTVRDPQGTATIQLRQNGDMEVSGNLIVKGELKQKSIEEQALMASKMEAQQREIADLKSRPRPPDYESPDWISATINQSGIIEHRLGTNRFSNFQIIIRHSEKESNEVIIQGMNDSWFYTPCAYGITFYIDQANDPTNKVRWLTGNGAIFAPTYPANGCIWPTSMSAYALREGQFKIRIWK